MPFAERLRALSRNQKILIATGTAVVVAVLAVVLTSGGGGEAATTTTTTTTEATTTTTLPPVAPLTGVPQANEARRSRPALVVKVDNVPAAFPLQEGIDNADIVYVEQVEHGATRMAVVFHSEDDTVGPVRSARTSDIAISAPLNNPLFAYSGANGGVLRLVRNGPMIDMGIDRAEATPVYTRNQRGSGLHRFFLPTDELYDAARDGAGTPPQVFAYRAEGVDPAGEPAAGVQIGYGGGAATVVRYEWDGAGWKRNQNGQPHVMADSEVQIAPENVIVQFIQYRSSGFRDVTGAVSPEAVLEGEGEAWVFTGGTLIRGRWSRPSRDQVTSYTHAAGNPIGLTPGQTFVELAPGAGSASVIEPPATSTT